MIEMQHLISNNKFMGVKTMIDEEVLKLINNALMEWQIARVRAKRRTK